MHMNNPGHMTKMATMPLYGKKPFLLSSYGTCWLSGERSLPLGFYFAHRRIK